MVVDVLRERLRDPWFEGTYVGVDIDNEMLEYCRDNFPAGRFKFLLSPHKSKTYSSGNLHGPSTTGCEFVIAEHNSKDFVYAFTLYTHLLEREVTDYL